MLPFPFLSLIATYFPALTSGLLLAASFPKPQVFFLAFAALVPLLVSIENMPGRQRFFAGLVTGVSFYASLIYWIVPTLSRYGGLAPVLSVSALMLFSLYLGVYVAGFTVFLNKLPQSPLVRPFWGGCLWVALEHIRTHALTGFPWGALGYSQYTNRVLVQIADTTGVDGISFLLVLSNLALAALYLAFKKTEAKTRQKRTVVFGFLGVLAIIAGAHILGYGKLSKTKDLIKNAPKTKIAVIQGNIRQDLKWDKAFIDDTIETYGKLSLSTVPEEPALIIWPETALPFYYGHDEVLSGRVNSFVKKAGIPFLIGSPALERKEEDILFFNRAFMLDQFSKVTGTYDKVHLVPFGEYVPLQDLLFFLEKLTQEAGNFSPGQRPLIPLVFDDKKTGVLICFEILFPDLAAEFVRNGADILTTMTNDAWFGRSAAPRQHFSFAVFRAVENRRSLVRAANTGISGYIDPSGNILEETGLFETAALVRTVPVLNQKTFYSRHPNLPGRLALVAIFLGFMVKRLNPNKEQTP